MDHDVASIGDLRARFRPPSDRAANKSHPIIDEGSARFISRSPFVLVATADRAGNCDVSPRGGPPGFAVVLDERHVALPDLNGNNRLDSYSNVVDNPHAGLLFIVPGKDDTVRVNGPARLTDDPAVLDRFTSELRRPKLALVVQANEVFGHCAKAFLRARLWQPDTWAEVADAPDLIDMYESSFGVEDPAATRAALAQAYASDLAQD